MDSLNGEPVNVFEIGTDFGVAEMWQPDMQQQRLASLLCYLGSLTVDGKTADAEITLRIPNLVMRKLYAERILKMVFPAPRTQDAAQAVAQRLFAQGEIQPLCTFIEEELLSIYANRDYLHFNELTLKTLFMSLLHYNHLYIMDSEPAIQRGYGDLSMIIRPGMRHYSLFDLLLEFKYLPLNKLRINQREGDTERKRTLTGEEIKVMNRTELESLDVIKEQLDEAREQLQRYRQVLQEKYGSELKLRAYAVVAVGFERLVWQEV